MSKQDGGPAFPATRTQPMSWAGWTTDDTDVAYSGMTLRDWFAGRAIVALINYQSDCTPAELAADAYRQADAMIIERAKNDRKI